MTGPVIDMADDIECPYCGYVDPDSWEVYGPMNEDDTITDQCLRCNKEYEVTMHVTYSFDMKGKEDDGNTDSKPNSGPD